MEDRDAQFINQIVIAADEFGGELRFRSAMNIDNQRSLAWKLRSVRSIQKTRNDLPIETLELDECRFRIYIGIQPTGFATGPSCHRERLRIDRISIRRAA